MTVREGHETDRVPAIRTLAIGEIAEVHPDVIAEFNKLHPVKAAATFGALLVTPELQASCFRIETLVHFALAYCRGRTAPSRPFVQRAFERLGAGYCGVMEDPAEDVFVTLVNTPRGNFRIFEGIREGTGFHLQRILNVVERMPDSGPFSRIRACVHSMLVLSEEVAGRAAVRENLSGQEMPLKSLPAKIVDRLSRSRDVIRFSEEDVERLKIPRELLAEFVFVSSGRAELSGQIIGHTDLERRPIALHNGSAYLLLPTAVASAVTRFVVERILSMGLGDTFERALSAEFAELFDHTPILGGPTGAPLIFQRINGGRISVVGTKVDPGRPLHILFFVDGLERFLDDGLRGANADPDALSAAIDAYFQHASAEGKKQADFLEGICLLVGCGLGRNLVLSADMEPPEGWRFETISAYDLATLSWVPYLDKFSLWRLLDSVDAIHREGAALLNVNGLLNLFACSERLNGDLVPHGGLPDGFISAGRQALIEVPQNAIRELRQRVLNEWNPRRVLNTDGQWVKARKLSPSEFEEDRAAPLYGSEDDLRNGKLRGVYVAPGRPWWIGITAPENAPRDAVFRLWMMLCTWLRRAAPILDGAYRSLPRGPISFDVRFKEVLGAIRDSAEPKSSEELRPLIRASAQPSCPQIAISVDKGFDDGLIQPENVAERLLVEALVTGAAIAGGESDDSNKREALVARVCPNSEARSLHRFHARSFRDILSSEIEDGPILAEPLDNGALRIGLGWRVKSRESGAVISGIVECTSYLNSLVQSILNEVCEELKRLDRLSFVRAVLHNHEVAAHNRDVWNRSSQANIAMHDDKQAALGTIVRHQGKLNACFIASRILLEAAICECPLEGGRSPGRLDLCRLMARVLAVHHYGGWSDAIHWGAMEARLRITPLGDVHMKPSYIDRVYDPFGQVGGETAVKEAADSYSTLYAVGETRASFGDVCGAEFQCAWTAEFGATLEGVRNFVDRLENLGSEPPKVLLELPRSTLLAMLASAAELSLTDASEALDVLSLKPRGEWRSAPGGFTHKDWYPWRFRRRLSVLRRPLIQVDSGEDPAVIFAPGLVREAFAAVVSWFHRGEIPASQARSVAMRRWIGHANNVQRREFNSTVATRMRDLGWQAEAEVRLKKILGRPLDRDYGDIDVLAWRPECGRVLIMECKDVQHLKTLGEVAEQLADFRGEVRSDGKPDHLRRHLDRLEVLTKNKATVATALKLCGPVEVEGHLVFKNPVPMQFAWDYMACRVRLSLFTELARI